jgi:histidinol phosphatase-like PHP family hydrolase
MRKKKDRGKKYRKEMKAISRTKTTYRKVYKSMAPKIGSEIIFTTDGRFMTLQEMKDIFDICYSVMELERAIVIDGTPSKSNTRLAQSIISAEVNIRYYYQYYRSINLTRNAAIKLMNAIRYTVFTIEKVPILSVSYDTFIEKMPRGNECSSLCEAMAMEVD